MSMAYCTSYIMLIYPILDSKEHVVCYKCEHAVKVRLLKTLELYIVCQVMTDSSIGTDLVQCAGEKRCPVRNQKVS